MLQGGKAFFYAGTGIVEGSNPSLEWKELEMKTSQVCTSIIWCLHWSLLPLFDIIICLMSDIIAELRKFNKHWALHFSPGFCMSKATILFFLTVHKLLERKGGCGRIFWDRYIKKVRVHADLVLHSFLLFVLFLSLSKVCSFIWIHEKS